MTEESVFYDAIIVGAGPAGLTAAIYLSRFRRNCLVLEDGHSRARWIPTSHNIPGFTAGIGGNELLGALRKQAESFNAQIRHFQVVGLAQIEGGFCVETDGERLHSRYVLLATGVRDHLPAIEGAENAVSQGLLRVCPICDAFEAIDKRMAVIGHGALVEREANFLKHYSDAVTILDVASSCVPGATAAGGIERISVHPSQLKIHNRRLTLALGQGERDFDVAYLALGCSPQHGLARSMFAQCDEHGCLKVNIHQETSVPNLYAAGDVVRGLNQVVVAAAESAIAAVDIHNKLRGAR
jgi:thioredoxin reductase (NADPH)